jgi:hypothetical protein
MMTRIFRAPGTHYRGQDVLEAPGVCTDASFAELAANGFNAVWLHARLRDAARPRVFPELGMAQGARRRDHREDGPGHPGDGRL